MLLNSLERSMELIFFSFILALSAEQMDILDLSEYVAV